MKRKTEYSAEGYVLGNMWGGGTGMYPAENLTATSKNKLYKTIKDRIKNGGLDSGMGFESLKGALMMIKKREFMNYSGKWYHGDSYEEKFFGKLTRDEKLFMERNSTFVL